MAVVVGRSVRISKSLLENESIDVAAMKDELTIQGAKTSDFVRRQPLVTYRERGGYIYVPKAYGMALVKEKRYAFARIDNAGNKIEVSFTGRLRENQVQPVQDTIRTLLTTEGAVMHMYCGFGKTTCCNFVSCSLGLKTLVLVHSTSLVEQWKQRIEDVIGGAAVGIIRQGTFDIENKTHVIGLMQSICKREYPKNAFASFGLTVIDECHHVCAENLSRCLEKAGSRYRLGLSATPFRKDGFTPFLFQAVGAISCTVERDHTTQDIQVNVIQLEVGPRDVHYMRQAGKQTINIARMITDLSQHNLRNEAITHSVHRHASNGRQVMVLSDRRAHLSHLHDTLAAAAHHNMSFMVGGASADVTRAASRANVIFATYAYASEGVDVPSLDTIVFATPRVDVVQTTGRILRSHNDKQKPLVIDFVDAFAVFRNQFSKRLRYYKKLGADIKHLSSTTSG